MLLGMFHEIAVEILGKEQEKNMENDKCAILELLLTKKDGLYPQEIADVYGVKLILVSKTLLALEFDKLVSRMIDGRYAITTHGMKRVMVTTISRDKSHTRQLGENDQ